MRHWIQSVKALWKTTSPKDTDTHSKYKASKNFMKRVRRREKEERDRLEKWRVELKKNKMSNYTYNTSIGNLSGSTITSNTIATTSLADTKVRIDNTIMQVDVPMIINGRDVMKELDEMRDSLLLLKRDVRMEEKYPRLKELKDEYEHALEKYKTFEAIKESK